MGIKAMFEVVRAALGGRKEEAEGVVLINPSDGSAIGAPGGTPLVTTLPSQLPPSLGIKSAAGSLSVTQASDNTFRTEPLGRPATARQLAAGVASASVQTTAGITRLSIYARGADVRFVLGAAAPTADAATSHFLGIGERLDIATSSGWYIAAIRAGTVDGTLEIMELA